MIPKKIHSIWVGKQSKPLLVRKCEQSWKKQCKDYQFIEWNEKNFNITEAPRYVQEAYTMKKWAFVSDYIRLWALYHHGGIYLDSDVELVKPLDCFLSHKSFSGFEDATHIQTGVIGAEKGNAIIKELLAGYVDKKFILDKGLNQTTNVITVTKMLEKKGLLKNNKAQLLLENLQIYPSEYFCPMSFETGQIQVTNNTYAIHHFSASWLSLKKRISLKIGRFLRRNK